MPSYTSDKSVKNAAIKPFVRIANEQAMEI